MFQGTYGYSFTSFTCAGAPIDERNAPRQRQSGSGAAGLHCGVKLADQAGLQAEFLGQGV